MPIQSGTHLGPYEILSAIGAGGMGEVYRARDPKLGRDVAIKVLPEAFARDAERMARFQREAKVLASLSHPNIATIYGLEDSGSTRALVMELVEGPTLADRIKAGPIPVDEGVRIARQIADALEYAHERGIIHRDLKPGNVKVTNDDTAKVLDFGLAKALEGDMSSIDISTSTTISRMATMQGVLLGTAAYMSPEQAKAKSVDRRADIWAFGCVLYEMLTGKQAFIGETVTESLAAVIMKDPEWAQLPSATPMRVRVLLQRCLQKDPKQRLQAIGDARISLDEVLSGAPESAAPGVAASALPAWRRAVPWALLGAMTVAFAAVAFVHFREKPTPATQVQRFEITAPHASANFVGALSPDGTRLVLGSSIGTPGRLWVRRMDSLETRPIEGTEGANGIPFWSPDSRFIVFGTQDGKLKKIDAEGGPAQILCDTGAPIIVGGFWTLDGKIVFGDPNHAQSLREVPAAGGESSPLPGQKQATTFGSLLPILLPGGRYFLYERGNPVSADVYLGRLDSRVEQQNSRKLLASVQPGLAYAPSPDDPDLGYLLFLRTTQGAPAGTLMAQPFDLRKMDLSGEAVPIAEQVPTADFSASLTGTLVYGSSEGSGIGQVGQINLFDRTGKILGTAGDPGNYQTMAFSPDGMRVVAARANPGSNFANLWVIDLARNISTRFTFGSHTDFFQEWSPDGNRIAFASDRDGYYDLYQKLSNGGSEDELLFKADLPAVPSSWSGDGRFMLFTKIGGPLTTDVWVLPMDANAHPTGKPFLFAQQEGDNNGTFSPGPQGHPLWIAYSSRESGRYEIYVRPFDPNAPTGTPPGAGKWQVSTEGGSSPRWNGNGRELFYIAPDHTVMSVEVSGTGGVFRSGIPRPLFKPKGLVPQPDYGVFWDASADGKKFIFAVSQSPDAAAAPAPPARFTVVLNWTSLLRK
jgi:eukaryotic-like serine/threonine-protein kinase